MTVYIYEMTSEKYIAAGRAGSTEGGAGSACLAGRCGRNFLCWHYMAAKERKEVPASDVDTYRQGIHEN